MPLAPGDRTLTALLRDRARRHGAKPFILFENRSISYAECEAASERLAASLGAQGVAQGTPVALLMDNKPETIFLYFALALLGAVAVPVNTAAKGEMLAYFLEQSESAFVFVDAALVDRVEAVRPQLPQLRLTVVVGEGGHDPATAAGPSLSYAELLAVEAALPARSARASDPYMIMYTSGTTGRSKGVLVPQGAVIGQAEAIAEACGYGPDDVLYTCLPLFHANAWWCSAIPAMLAGGTLALSRRFSASQFWSEVRRFRATQFNLLGAMATFLWNQPPGPADRDHRVRQALVVPVPTAFYHGFEERFGLTLKSLYGLTDAGISAIKREGDPPEKWRSAGRPCDYAEIRIADEEDFALPPGEVGEILIRSKRPWTMAQGYLRMPRETAASWRNLWLHSGDRGYLDEDGFLYFVDRKKDAIRRRGENVSAYEVELIVQKHEAVAEAAAFGVTSEHGEEEVMVAVVLKPGMALAPAELIAHCQANLAYFMVPRFVEFLAALPKNMSEKVEKYRLRESAETRLATVWDREKAGIVVAR